MRDREIRARLRAELESLHRGDDGTLIVDELGVLQGAARVDMAVVNGSLSAWEIKSERDTLRRLPAQAEAYSKVFDQVTLVVAAGHEQHAVALVPDWWGVRVVLDDGAKGAFDTVRPARHNPAVEPVALASLLWRDEALELLASHGLDRGLRSKPRKVLWATLAEHLDPAHLADHVRETLKVRPAWRADNPPR